MERIVIRVQIAIMLVCVFIPSCKRDEEDRKSEWVRGKAASMVFAGYNLINMEIAEGNYEIGSDFLKGVGRRTPLEFLIYRKEEVGHVVWHEFEDGIVIFAIKDRIYEVNKEIFKQRLSAEKFQSLISESKPFETEE